MKGLSLGTSCWSLFEGAIRLALTGGPGNKIVTILLPKGG
jgi:hypothetical protein